MSVSVERVLSTTHRRRRRSLRPFASAVLLLLSLGAVPTLSQTPPPTPICKEWHQRSDCTAACDGCVWCQQLNDSSTKAGRCIDQPDENNVKPLSLCPNGGDGYEAISSTCPLGKGIVIMFLCIAGMAAFILLVCACVCCSDWIYNGAAACRRRWTVSRGGGKQYDTLP